MWSQRSLLSSLSSYLPRLRFAATRTLSTESGVNKTTQFDDLFQSPSPDTRDKNTFLSAIGAFKEGRSRTHVEFINTALKFIKEYKAHKDLDTYKALLNVFPKGKMIPQNTFQRIMLHYPQQQNCCVKVLDEMEWHGKVKRMLYWMPKLKHSNKYLDRRHVEGKNLSAAELAALALRMMCRDPATVIHFQKLLGGSEEKGEWLTSAQSVAQQRIIQRLAPKTQVFLDGPFRVYVMELRVEYMQMTASSLDKVDKQFEFQKHSSVPEENYSNMYEEWKEERRKGRSIHEQRDETILALAASSRICNDTGRDWLDHLQQSSPRLSEMLIRIRLEKEEEASRESNRDSNAAATE